MKKLSRRALLLGVGGVAGFTASGKLRTTLPTLAGTESLKVPSGPAMLNDASGLSATPIHKHIISSDSYSDRLLETVRAAMTEATESNRPLNVGAARHSMGGQAIARDGIAMTLNNGAVELDTANSLYRVHAGARWSQVITALDASGWSPVIMQSNNDFGVAATFSVNAHGWPVPFGPMASSVRAIRMVLPNGELVECSREKNSDLFKHAMGGYGLMGVITDLDIKMVRNSRLAPTFKKMPAKNIAGAFESAIEDPAVTMAYGRLNVERATFFEQALLVTYRETEDQLNLPEATSASFKASYASKVYRAQMGNERMKSFRWWNETVVGPKLGTGEVTRNALMNGSVDIIANRNPNRTFILHEYFIGFDRFNDFLQLCRDVIPKSFQEFLNVTLRYIAADKESVLSYAPVPRLAAVMSFSQEMTKRAEADMQRMTRELIDAVLAIEGTYYLPYRPHATVAQFSTAYSRGSEFAAFKRDNDRGLLLRNNLWDTYLNKL